MGEGAALMGRREFTAETQRLAWGRSGEQCEAIGALYGFPEGVRCNADLKLGVNYDHIDPDANSKDNSLQNCCACCPKCHRWKTSNRDRPLIAKTNHQQDSARNISKPNKQHMPGSRASGIRKRMSGAVERW